MSLENQPPLKDYLGDSVYAEWDGYSITLTTDNGFGPSNAIVLDPLTLAALDRFVARAQEIVRAAEARPQPKGEV